MQSFWTLDFLLKEEAELVSKNQTILLLFKQLLITIQQLHKNLEQYGFD